MNGKRYSIVTNVN